MDGIAFPKFNGKTLLATSSIYKYSLILYDEVFGKKQKF